LTDQDQLRAKSTVRYFGFKKYFGFKIILLLSLLRDHKVSTNSRAPWQQRSEGKGFPLAIRMRGVFLSRRL
jgi:hypothetical protein